jgi:THO complex subunit 2
LDPNRVLDLLLDVLETRMPSGNDKPAQTDVLKKILELLQQFSVEKIPHLLGFKICSSSIVRHSLYTTVAFLATEEVLDIRAILPHLPSISDIDTVHELFEKCEHQQIQAMGRIRLNADDGKKEDPKLMADITKLNEATKALEKNSLIELVRILLLWKEWELAKLLLRGTFDKVCTLLPNSIGQVLCDFVSERIQVVYHANVPAPLSERLKNPSPSQLPESASLNEVLDAVFEPLEGIMESACIASHPILYCLLCRLMKVLLEKEKSKDSLIGTAYLLLKMLVSSLSLFPPNPAISADLWALLSIFPYPTRYSLYNEWRGGGLERAGLSSKPLPQVKCEMEAGKAARYALKRLSKDNVRDMGRQVSKVTHSNPFVVFSTILSQVESYDNLIDMMVEAVRFVTPLGLDVLGYCILSRLDGTSDSGNRTRMKGKQHCRTTRNTVSANIETYIIRTIFVDDGVNVSQWLSSLESFTGSFYKRCPQVEFRGLLWYLIGRLKDGHVEEIGILRTLLKTAGGYGFADYSPVASLAATQLEGRAGSQMLKRETFAFGVVDQTDLRASRIVRSVLQDDNMGVMILILLAQIRTKVIFNTSGKRPTPVKLIGNLYDSCQVLMTMLLEFLTDKTDEALENGQSVRSTSAMQLYAESLPSLKELYGKYGLDAESAWMLCRPISRAAVVEETSESGKGKKESTEAVQSFLPTGEVMADIYRGMLPENAWECMTVDLFELFFSHALYDMCYPEGCYEAEIARLKKEAERLIQRQKGNPGSLIAGPPFSKADEMELERMQRACDILTSDMSTQKKRNEMMLNAFEARKDSCFPSETISSGNTIQAFLMHCIYPRCMSSPDDAMYCAQFVSLLHQNNTPGFSTLLYIDELVDVVAGALYCVTEGEAANMAIMLLETWKMVSRWRYDEVAFATEVADRVRK